MDSKQIRKSIGRFLGWIGLYGCSLIIKIIPEQLLYDFAGFLAFWVYIFAKKQRKIALESLAIAFGNEKTAEERERIARDCFVFMAKAGVELVSLMDKPAVLKRHAQLIGRENLDQALARGKGVILVSAHFGNFPLLMACLAQHGYKIAGIMRIMRDMRAERFFLVKRNKMGIKTIYTQPRRACVDNIIKSLRNNEVVFIPLDQHFGAGGVFVEFFGRQAATAVGPVILAQRTKAAIIPCFIVRQKDDTHRIIFEPRLELEEKSSPQLTVVANIQRLTRIIEAYIRKYPAEWGWIHRRWKTEAGK